MLLRYGSWCRSWSRSAIHLKFPKGIPPLGPTLRSVHLNVTAAAGHRDDVQTAIAICLVVDCLPIDCIVRKLNSILPTIGGFPIEPDLLDRISRSKVYINPLRVAEGRRPTGIHTSVKRIRLGIAITLDRGSLSLLAER